MNDRLLQLFYFLRPLMFAYLPISVLGLSVFELFTVVLVLLLGLAFLFAGSDYARGMDALDKLMIAFAVWCVVATMAQLEYSDWKWAMRFALPFATYILLRSLVRTQADFLRYLQRMVLAFLIIVSVNSVAIYLGRGLFNVNWFTGMARYQGIFNDLHTMAHTVSFALMATALYVGLSKAWTGRALRRQSPLMMAVAILMVPLVLYCLYKGNVRTVLVGLVAFAGIYLWMTNRMKFVAFLAVVMVVWLSSTYIKALFWDVTAGPTPIGGNSIEMAGSGRPWIWKHNLELYADAPIEQKIVGVGVGNEIGVIGANGLITAEYRNRAWASHNDFLSILMQLGMVGFGLLVAIYWLMFRRIMRLPPDSRPLFLALFGAVLVMNFLSNSYVTRVGLGQLFVMVLVGIHCIPTSQRATAPHVVWRPDPRPVHW